MVYKIKSISHNKIWQILLPKQKWLYQNKWEMLFNFNHRLKCFLFLFYNVRSFMMKKKKKSCAPIRTKSIWNRVCHMGIGYKQRIVTWGIYKMVLHVLTLTTQHAWWFYCQPELKGVYFCHDFGCSCTVQICLWWWFCLGSLVDSHHDLDGRFNFSLSMKLLVLMCAWLNYLLLAYLL